jgi:carbonic anhydrase/acetyltransferase-like protein (isoleucine patch superfamily)
MAIILPFGGVTPDIDARAFVAPTATLIGHVIVEAEATIWFGAVLRGDDPRHPIRIGPRTSIQDNCVIHVSSRGPTVIGADVTVGHGAVMESCEIGRGALIGMNAVVLQGARVGEEALVAAGAVVGSGTTVPARHLAAGAPATVKKALSGESLHWVRTSAAHYVALGREYREAAKAVSPEPGG